MTKDLKPRTVARRILATRLRKLLSYDPTTGEFTRIKSSGGRFAGSKAGCKNTAGYIVIRVDDRLYLAHRLAWLYVTGDWPQHDIDHINGERTDNRFSNLRECNMSLNLQNRRRANTNNKLGLLGVIALRNGYTASINVLGKQVWLGMHKTPEAAHAAYIKAKRKLHPYGEL